MDEIQHTLVRCPLRGQSNGKVGAKLERACRTCPGRGKSLYPAPAKNPAPVRSLVSGDVIMCRWGVAKDRTIGEIGLR